jgi:hypothetical protein
MQGAWIVLLAHVHRCVHRVVHGKRERLDCRDVGAIRACLRGELRGVQRVVMRGRDKQLIADDGVRALALR